MWPCLVMENGLIFKIENIDSYKFSMSLLASSTTTSFIKFDSSWVAQQNPSIKIKLQSSKLSSKILQNLILITLVWSHHKSLSHMKILCKPTNPFLQTKKIQTFNIHKSIIKLQWLKLNNTTTKGMQKNDKNWIFIYWY